MASCAAATGEERKGWILHPCGASLRDTTSGTRHIGTVDWVSPGARGDTAGLHASAWQLRNQDSSLCDLCGFECDLWRGKPSGVALGTSLGALDASWGLLGALSEPAEGQEGTLGVLRGTLGRSAVSG